MDSYCPLPGESTFWAQPYQAGCCIFHVADGLMCVSVALLRFPSAAAHEWASSAFVSRGDSLTGPYTLAAEITGRPHWRHQCSGFCPDHDILWAHHLPGAALLSTLPPLHAHLQVELSDTQS